tara:strand:+ start:4576 stop:4896 length:321 start_codon:yes stop_codon:yes gene_type:complete
MNKFIIKILFVITIFTINGNAQAESKIATKVYGSKDCSQHSTKTLAGLVDYARCKKGQPAGKNILKDLEFKKKDKALTQKKVNCNDYTTKTFTGLINKMKCKREKK